MKSTKEEISLFKQIAEKYRKELVYGDWYISYDGVIRLKALHQKGHRHEECIPFWTIKNCLEWLKKRYDDVDVGSIQGKWEVQIHDAYDRVHHPEFLEDIFGETPLEACLTAILAVVEYKQ